MSIPRPVLMDQRSRVVYALIDPRTDGIRYIGITLSKDRLQEHVLRARRGGRTHRDSWIRSLLKRSLMPIFKVLERVPYHLDWEERERVWIAHGRSVGWDLTNHCDGGEGVRGHVFTDWDKRRIVEGLRRNPRPPLSDAALQSISEKQRASWKRKYEWRCSIIRRQPQNKKGFKKGSNAPA